MVRLDVSSFELKLKLLDDTIAKTKLLCSNDKVESFSSCGASLKVLEQILPTLYAKHESFGDLLGNTRVKRGLIDGIGSIFKAVFRVLDHTDAEY